MQTVFAASCTGVDKVVYSTMTPIKKTVHVDERYSCDASRQIFEVHSLLGNLYMSHSRRIFKRLRAV